MKPSAYENIFIWIILPLSVCLSDCGCLSLCLSVSLPLCLSFSLRPSLPPTHPSVSDLAPGQSGVDDMKMLEQKAQQLAAEAEQDKPKPKDKILFVRSDTFLPALYFISSQHHT